MYSYVKRGDIVSLNIQREKETIRIRYQDDNRSGEVVIDLNENNVIIYQANNLRIIFEVSKSALLEIEEKIKEHAKVDIGKLRHALKTEIENMHGKLAKYYLLRR